ncbi:MAG: DUF4349 domain-containing protein [Cyanobacteria bacterium J06648_11]
MSKQRQWLGSVAIATAVLSGCGAVTESQLAQGIATNDITTNESAIEMDAIAAEPIAPSAPAPADRALPVEPVGEPRQTTRSQLVRTAELHLRVESIPAALLELNALLDRERGDVLEMNHSTPVTEGDRQTAWMRARVPQERLDRAIVELHSLGDITHQSVTAEDVSAQLVDYEARLTNLRKAEASVLSIMERSGKLSDVLEVSRELSRIRESIERISAQQANLSARVAYSTLYVNLESASANMPLSRSPGRLLAQSWKRSTHSVSQFSLTLLQAGIWVLAYSPYAFAIALGIWAIRAQRNR